MIIPEIIKDLATRIANLGFVSLSGGVVSDLKNGDKISPFGQVYPFTNGPKFFSPDANQTAITFFKVGPTSERNSNTYISQWENEIKLIGWINGKRINDAECLDAQMQILQAVRQARLTPSDGSPLRTVDITFSGDNEGQPIGQEYGWNDVSFQYGIYPYRLFELRFKLIYNVASGCNTSPIDVLKPIC